MSKFISSVWGFSTGAGISWYVTRDYLHQMQSLRDEAGNIRYNLENEKQIVDKFEKRRRGETDWSNYFKRTWNKSLRTAAVKTASFWE